MAASPERGALIGPGTYAEIKRVIERVGGVPLPGGDVAKIPTDLSGSDVYVAHAIRRGTFSPPWGKGEQKTVTDATDETLTIAVKNYFADLSGTGTRACAIARVGSEWILIAAEC